MEFNLADLTSNQTDVHGDWWDLFIGIIQEMDIFQPLITTRFVLIQRTLLVSKPMIVGQILGREK